MGLQTFPETIGEEVDVTFCGSVRHSRSGNQKSLVFVPLLYM